MLEIKRFGPGPRMSKAISYNGFLFVSGQVADNTDDTVAGQTQQILDKIDSILAEAGTDKSKILSANIWIADYKTFDEMNAVWDAWVAEDAAPTRACVESKLAFPQFTVEIGVIAAV